jgi:hypothetical protein
MTCERNYTLEAMLTEMSDEELETYVQAHRGLTSRELVFELKKRWQDCRYRLEELEH